MQTRRAAQATHRSVGGPAPKSSPRPVAVHAVPVVDMPSAASVAVVGAGTVGLMTLMAA